MLSTTLGMPMEWLYSAFGNTKLNSVLAAADIRLESERKRIETAIATETETVTETMEAAVAMPPSRMVIGIATIARRTISPSETLASSAMLRKIEKGVRVANVVDAASRAKCRPESFALWRDLVDMHFFKEVCRMAQQVVCSAT
mmetsp:Transcript_79949/g.124681  ORF Transcript_79949/g.124681 Transcript_79949/m.124681 type:complete len:144 (+) Transcript_79949:337-768(+)